MERQRLPEWLRSEKIVSEAAHPTRRLLRQHRLHSVCEEARCPNRGECFSHRTASFLILGERCTRGCAFCAVGHQPLAAPDPEEPRELALAVREMGLRFVVITSVTRDDLPDGGAGHFAACVTALREMAPEVRVEVLVPDFLGSLESLRTVLEARPDVFNHNVETVARLYPIVRPQADYARSLEMLRRARELGDPSMPVKSGLMVGLGEEREEIEAVMADLLANGCDVLTIGQYLQPTRANLPVSRYVHPEEFRAFEEKGKALGFRAVHAGPLVRSSYFAETLFESLPTDGARS